MSFSAAARFPNWKMPLQKKGVECEAFPFDVSDRASVRKPDKHAAGVSLHMGNA